jgi:hypothetical protein
VVALGRVVEVKVDVLVPADEDPETVGGKADRAGLAHVADVLQRDPELVVGQGATPGEEVDAAGADAEDARRGNEQATDLGVVDGVDLFAPQVERVAESRDAALDLGVARFVGRRRRYIVWVVGRVGVGRGAADGFDARPGHQAWRDSGIAELGGREAGAGGYEGAHPSQSAVERIPERRFGGRDAQAEGALVLLTGVDLDGVQDRSSEVVAAFGVADAIERDADPVALSRVLERPDDVGDLFVETERLFGVVHPVAG